MPYINYLTHRVTNRYTDDYSHLDVWGDKPVKFKFLASRQIAEPTGFDDGGVRSMRIVGSKTLDQDMQARILRDNLSRYDCSHEYDCCGCASVSARIHKTKRGIFTAILHTSYNY